MFNDLKNIPSHVGIIMDGNGRWARVRGMDTANGHLEGARRVKPTVKYCGELGVDYLSLFAFSTENWNRPGGEVNALMELLVQFLEDELEPLKRDNVRFMSYGRRDRFSPEVVSALDRAETATAANTGICLVLCLDYGGRQEIVYAAGRAEGPVDEAEFRKLLYRPEIPDIDLLIRTSGEERISNFMLWQSAYAELYFTDVLWPDFRDEDILRAVRSYGMRERRFGLRCDEQ